MMTTPEEKMREVVDTCADCDVCRHLMDVDCLFFPELYRLFDRETESGKVIGARQLRHLPDLCNFCALCPCPNIRSDIISAKTGFIARDGLQFGVRTIEDVGRIGRICGTFPGMVNLFLRHRLTGKMSKKILGIHPQRRFPEIPAQQFDPWVMQQGLHLKKNPGKKRRVAYFAGCTGRYLFPAVPRAAVAVLEANGIEVFYPQQKCCGMPSLLEGDRGLTMSFVRFNVQHLVSAVKEGCEIVCSCPTCGFFLKRILSEGAYYSPAYQAKVGQNPNHMRVPVGKDRIDGPGQNGFMLLETSIYGRILKDDGYFSGVSPTDRILIAENTYDLGEYLKRLNDNRAYKPPENTVPGRMVYFPPCHGREQNIGRPYPEMLASIPDVELESIEGHFYCCGMGGVMGFKKEFHDASIQLGQRLMDRIRVMEPDAIVTDCLSCRLQFNQLTPFRVAHPVEILKESYTGT